MNRRHLLSLIASGPLLALQKAANAAGSALATSEPPLDPGRAIVDSHHHLWHQRPTDGYTLQRFLLPELLETIEASGHNITHTAAVECNAMHRADGLPELRPTGETEFINGIAAMSASGRYGRTRVAAAFVGNADLRLGDGVKPVLEAHVAAAPARFRGIRMFTASAGKPFFSVLPSASPGLLLDTQVQRGAAHLAPLGLSWAAFRIQRLSSTILEHRCSQAIEPRYFRTGKPRSSSLRVARTSWSRSVG
jgi:hypothetical protein